jgi:hypothetical protein
MNNPYRRTIEHIQQPARKKTIRERIKCFFGAHRLPLIEIWYGSGWYRYQCKCCGKKASAFRDGFWWD